MLTAEDGDLAQLVSADQKQFIIRLEAGGQLQTHHGVIRHEALIGLPWGSVVETHLGRPFYVLQPTLQSLLLHIRRKSQVIFPKDIGYILLRLALSAGMKVIEAGTGSGALTTALAWAVGPRGRVISYDSRPDMQELALENLRKVGLEDRVTLRLHDISQGFDENEADALFLDLPNAHDYIPQARSALRNGGVFGAILPTSNQVSSMIAALSENRFALLDVCEILLRFYKPVADRLRPIDRMVAHTGYLVFARPVLGEPLRATRRVKHASEMFGL